MLLLRKIIITLIEIPKHVSHIFKILEVLGNWQTKLLVYNRFDISFVKASSRSLQTCLNNLRCAVYRYYDMNNSRKTVQSACIHKTEPISLRMTSLMCWIDLSYAIGATRGPFSLLKLRSLKLLQITKVLPRVIPPARIVSYIAAFATFIQSSSVTKKSCRTSEERKKCYSGDIPEWNGSNRWRVNQIRYIIRCNSS